MKTIALCLFVGPPAIIVFLFIWWLSDDLLGATIFGVGMAGLILDVLLNSNEKS